MDTTNTVKRMKPFARKNIQATSNRQAFANTIPRQDSDEVKQPEIIVEEDVVVTDDEKDHQDVIDQKPEDNEVASEEPEDNEVASEEPEDNEVASEEPEDDEVPSGEPEDDEVPSGEDEPGSTEEMVKDEEVAKSFNVEDFDLSFHRICYLHALAVKDAVHKKHGVELDIKDLIDVYQSSFDKQISINVVDNKEISRLSKAADKKKGKITKGAKTCLRIMSSKSERAGEPCGKVVTERSSAYPYFCCGCMRMPTMQRKSNRDDVIEACIKGGLMTKTDKKELLKKLGETSGKKSDEEKKKKALPHKRK